MSDNPLPTRLLISFPFFMEFYNSPFVKGNDFVYSEITKQIFDVMDTRFNVFIQKLESLPNFDLLPLENRAISFIDVRRFKEAIKAFALSIYFTFFDYKLFKEGNFPYILESIQHDRCLLYLANS